MRNNTSVSRSFRPTSHDKTLAPLVAAGILAVSGAWATYRAWSPRRSNPAAENHESLAAYLRDHLSGADAAIQVVRRLSSSHSDADDVWLFRQLTEELERDRESLRSVFTQLGISPRSPKRVAGYTSGLLLSVAAGGQPGTLSLFRTLEALAIGIQGKRCMWRALQELGTGALTVHESLIELESRAIRQWERVEERRRALVPRTFPTFESGIQSRPASQRSIS